MTISVRMNIVFNFFNSINFINFSNFLNSFISDSAAKVRKIFLFEQFLIKIDVLDVHNIVIFYFFIKILHIFFANVQKMMYLCTKF